MNAIQIAKDMEALDLDGVAAMLRKQHEAIKTLREALGEIEWSNNSLWQSDRAKAALAATEKL